jgi:hypothetical protein
MSLWYESLLFSLYDCGPNLKERAKCIIAYLSMPVPRSWWEEASETGRVQDTHAQVLQNLRMELSKVVNLRDRLSSGVLVALAFMEVETEGVLGDRFGQVDSQYSLDDCLTKAEKVLAKRPDLVELGRLIDNLELGGRNENDPRKPDGRKRYP